MRTTHNALPWGRGKASYVQEKKMRKVVNLLWVPIKKFRICIINLAAQEIKGKAEKAEPGKGKRERKRDSIQLDLCIVFCYYNTIFYKEKYKSQICKGL